MFINIAVIVKYGCKKRLNCRISRAIVNKIEYIAL